MTSNSVIQVGNRVNRSSLNCRRIPIPVTVLVMSDRLALTLRQAIRAERARQGLTQEDLAKKLGWTRQVVWTVETGARTVAMHEMPDICRALNVTLSRLLVDAAQEDRDALGI
jgi:ribosome-binding protein aMBF1 (putative translation factor)